jgi:hypothetical protein
MKMRFILNRYVFLTVLVTFGLHVMSFPALGGATFVAGKPTAGEAASWRVGSEDGGVELETTHTLAGALHMAYVQPDTTEFEFPEDDTKHLARDITVFVIAAAFVGYFIVKVFLQGDTEKEEEEEKGKEIPVF